MLERRGFILSALLAPFAPLLVRLRPAAAPVPTYGGIPLEYVSDLDETIVYETYVPETTLASFDATGFTLDLSVPEARKEDVRW